MTTMSVEKISIENAMAEEIRTLYRKGMMALNYRPGAALDEALFRQCFMKEADRRGLSYHKNVAWPTAVELEERR